MKKFMTLLLAVLLASCSPQKGDGIFPADNGWDVVVDGKVYAYRCEPDGLYLYIDWDGLKSYIVEFTYKQEIYRKTVGHNGTQSFTAMDFLCKNKDGKFVYVANYADFDGCFYDLKEIGFQIDGGRTVIYPYPSVKHYFGLLEKYVK